jgi:succinate dehydrogenase hydrophobic anchor subunit
MKNERNLSPSGFLFVAAVSFGFMHKPIKKWIFLTLLYVLLLHGMIGDIKNNAALIVITELMEMSGLEYIMHFFLYNIKLE